MNFYQSESYLFQIFKDNRGNYIIKDPCSTIGKLPSIKVIEMMISKLNQLKDKGESYINSYNNAIINDFIDYQKYYIGKNQKVKRYKVKRYIYCIKCGNYYKIGKAKKLNNRIKTHQTSNPNKIELIFEELVSNCNEVEKEIHEIFVNKRYKGEWFKLDKDDLIILKNKLKLYAK